jgi:protein-tyrosine phosphatase
MVTTQPFIDLHCHILPGIDDGAQTMEESIAMAQAAVKQGITHILATPHVNHRYQNDADIVFEKVTELQKELNAREIPLQIFEGQEIRIYEDLVQDFLSGKLLTADVEGRYMLIELPTQTIPEYTFPVLQKLISIGVTPIIVHPERYLSIQENPSNVLDFLSQGCLLQLTAPSICGIYGKETKNTAIELVKHGYIHMIASDAHGKGKRDFYMKQAFEKLEKQFGHNTTEYFNDVARSVVNGSDLPKSCHDR